MQTEAAGGLAESIEKRAGTTASVSSEAGCEELLGVVPFEELAADRWMCCLAHPHDQRKDRELSPFVSLDDSALQSRIDLFGELSAIKLVK